MKRKGTGYSVVYLGKLLIIDGGFSKAYRAGTIVENI